MIKWTKVKTYDGTEFYTTILGGVKVYRDRDNTWFIKHEGIMKAVTLTPLSDHEMILVSNSNGILAEFDLDVL